MKTNHQRRLKLLLLDLNKLATLNRTCADMLRREVKEGRCVHQSPEAKLARAQILEADRQSLLELIQKYEPRRP